MKTVRHIILITLLGAGLVSTSALATAGDEPTREFSSPYTSLRLMNAGEQSGVWHSGVYITMQKGWKTYWRVPGDGGVPPSFDWSGSENVAATTVMMPLPHRFTDENGEGIGYKTEVVFPVDVKPADPSKPAMLDLKIFYAVCNDICVPVQAQVKVGIDAGTVSASDKFRLRVARATVPVDADADRLAVTSLKQVEMAGKRALEVSLKGLKSPAEADIFVEVAGNSYFRKPELLSQSGDTSTWRIAVDSYGDAVSLAGKPVRLTIADGDTGLVHEGVLQ
ncbi:MAG: protein-disulfide reductase DsbD domain-containing protein [Pseudomonadota bacterium]